MTDESVLGRYGISAEAELLWRALLANPTAYPSHLANAAGVGGDDIELLLTSLARAHLLRRDSTMPTGFAPNDPSVALELLAVRAERQIAADTEQVAIVRSQILELNGLFAAGRARAGILPGFEIVTSLREIREQIYLEGQRTRFELRSLLHNTGAEAADDSRDVDRDAFRRGIKLRSIVRPIDLQKPRLYEAIAWLHDQGEDVRASDAVPTQMQIFDRTLAVIRVDPNDTSQGAMFIRVANLIDLLIDLYERLWQDAEPLFPAFTSEIALTARQLRILTLLAAGAKDEAIARSLSVGVRTIRRDLSELKELAAASSRTDLITSAIRRGWIPTPQSKGESKGLAEPHLNQAVEIP